MTLKNPQNLKKMLRNSPALDASAAIFKNADFCESSLKIRKLRNF